MRPHFRSLPSLCLMIAVFSPFLQPSAIFVSRFSPWLATARVTSYIVAVTLVISATSSTLACSEIFSFRMYCWIHTLHAHEIEERGSVTSSHTRPLRLVITIGGVYQALLVLGTHPFRPALRHIRVQRCKSRPKHCIFCAW